MPVEGPKKRHSNTRSDVDSNKSTKEKAPKLQSTPVILTPVFREVQSFVRTLPCKVKKSQKSKAKNREAFEYEAHHRPLELAEKRARRREAELDRYQEYLTKLKAEAPQLWKF